MASKNGMNVEQPDSSPLPSYNRVENMVPGTCDGPNDYGQGRPTYGATAQVLDEKRKFHELAASLFDGKLILPKALKPSFNIGERSNYSPNSGESVGIPQTPLYLCTVDDDHKIIVKFPDGFKPPLNLDGYYLGVFLLATSDTYQLYKHINKFRQYQEDGTALDTNPLLIDLTAEDFEKGEIGFQLGITKTPESELKNVKSLRLFDEWPISAEIKDCKSVEDLKNTYALHRAKIAFSVGYLNTEAQFIRLEKTTIVSNEIVEVQQPKETNYVSCPNYSHQFDPNEQ